MLLKSIIKRTGIRSDKIWGSWLLFREPFRRIPFYMDVYALSKSQYWPREKLKELQMERFAAIVKHASQIPFWKERFQKAGINPNNFHESDIARIPVLTKKDFLDREVKEYTVPELLPKSRQYHTSGSTGRPLNFYHDPQFELRSSAVSERMFRIAGDGERFPVIYMRGSFHNGYDYVPLHFFYVRGYNDVRHRIREFENVISRFQNGVIIFALGSSLLELARVCKEMNLSFHIRCVLSVGEELRASQITEIEESLKTQFRIMYGSSETRRLGFQCEHHRLHLNEEVAWVEITDEHEVPLPNGEKGRVVVTGFDHRVMLFIRYDTGDIGVIHKDLCPCGRTLRTLEFHGRHLKLLDLGNGRTVSVMDLFFLFDAYHDVIRQFQIVRTGKCTFVVRIVPGPQFKKEGMDKDLMDRSRVYIHPNVQIEWEIVNSIPEGPNGKAVYFIDQFEKQLPNSNYG